MLSGSLMEGGREFFLFYFFFTFSVCVDNCFIHRQAIKLIRAVAMLLNFSHQEQQLIKDTLEWKMSWFGPKPSLGKGQKSKVIPPTY
jgi:golgin subfamily A protein 1